MARESMSEIAKLEMEIEAMMKEEDYFDDKVRIKEELSNVDSNVLENLELVYAKPTGGFMHQKITEETKMSNLRDNKPVSQVNMEPCQPYDPLPTFNLDMNMFHKNKDKIPLYLMNPYDYPDDPVQQLRIRRATITYRHHQEKKVLIRRLTEENCNLKKVLQIYSLREDAVTEFCSCPSAKKFIKAFDPKTLLIEFPLAPKLKPLPPMKQLSMDVPKKIDVVGQSQVVRNFEAHMTQLAPTQIQNTASSFVKMLGPHKKPPDAPLAGAERDQLRYAVKSHLERLNRMESPAKQKQVSKISILDRSYSKQKISTQGPSIDPGVYQILQQMNFADVRCDLANKNQMLNISQSGTKAEGEKHKHQSSTSSTPAPEFIGNEPPTAKKFVLAQTGQRYVLTPTSITGISEIKIKDSQNLFIRTQDVGNKSCLFRPITLEPGQNAILPYSIKTQDESLNSGLTIKSQNSPNMAKLQSASGQKIQPGSSVINFKEIKSLKNPIVQSKTISPVKLEQLVEQNESPCSSLLSQISPLPQHIEIIKPLDEDDDNVELKTQSSTIEPLLETYYAPENGISSNSDTPPLKTVSPVKLEQMVQQNLSPCSSLQSQIGPQKLPIEIIDILDDDEDEVPLKTQSGLSTDINPLLVTQYTPENGISSASDVLPLKTISPVKLEHLVQQTQSTLPRSSLQSKIGPQKQPIEIIDILDEDDDEVQLKPQSTDIKPLLATQYTPENAISSASDTLRLETVNLRIKLSGSEIRTVKKKPPAMDMDEPLKVTKRKYSQEPVVNNIPIIYGRKRSKRSAALCQPNAKQLLKGVKIPRKSCVATTMPVSSVTTMNAKTEVLDGTESSSKKPKLSRY